MGYVSDNQQASYIDKICSLTRTHLAPFVFVGGPTEILFSTMA